MNTRRTILITAVIGILLIPFIAMQFSNEVNWNLSDFVIAGVLLSTLALANEILFGTTRNPKTRYLLLTLILGIGFIIWAELAVGLFGSPFAGN